jgi:hypothetical protein
MPRGDRILRFRCVLWPEPTAVKWRPFGVSARLPDLPAKAVLSTSWALVLLLRHAVILSLAGSFTCTRQKRLPKLFHFCNKKRSVSRIGSWNCYCNEKNLPSIRRLSPKRVPRARSHEMFDSIKHSDVGLVWRKYAQPRAANP